MRLRLIVQRNTLPTSHILWSVPDTASPQAYTVARLLEDVNRILPLEAEQWGLEDYIVELGGFECLHFSPVLETLKEDDQVSIRPLLTAEVRSRTLCGRKQISEDGRHLVDGIPFGRPYLRQPYRPAVTIPPRKRRRTEEDTTGGSEKPDTAGYIILGREAASPMHVSSSKKGKKEVQFVEADGVDSEDSEADEDFVPGHVSEGSLSSESDDDSSSAGSEASIQAQKSSIRHSLQRSGSDDSSASEIDNSSGSNSDSGSAPDSDSEIEPDPNAEASVDSGSDNESDSTNSDSNSDSDSDIDSNSSAPDVLSSKPAVAPWSGSAQTRRRNRRRAQLTKLKKLKAEGKLHPDATYADLRLYLGEPTDNIELESSMATPAHPMSRPTGKRKRLDEEVENYDTKTLADESAELERRRQDLMARLADSAPDIEMILESTPAEASTSIVEQMEEPSSKSGSSVSESSPKENTATPTPPTKRIRPNISAIGHILQRQAVNVERKTLKSKKTPVVEEPTEPEGASDPDFWKARVNLSAFECWNEEHELSAPPFPFEQHWDPASKLMRENQQNAHKKRKGRKNKQRAVFANEANEDEEPEETPVLDYDDSPETAKTSTDPTDAIKSQILQDVELATKTDLPPLPDDVNALPVLQPPDIQVGAVVVFKLYAIDPVTVTPHISEYKTATVEKEGDSGNGAGTFRLKLGERDIPKKDVESHEKGPVKNAVSSFRMDDDEGDDSIWEGTFSELVEPKLLRAAT